MEFPHIPMMLLVYRNGTADIGEPVIPFIEYAGRDGAFRPRAWCMKAGEMVQLFRAYGA